MNAYCCVEFKHHVLLNHIDETEGNGRSYFYLVLSEFPMIEPYTGSGLITFRFCPWCGKEIPK